MIDVAVRIRGLRPLLTHSPKRMYDVKTMATKKPGKVVEYSPEEEAERTAFDGQGEVRILSPQPKTDPSREEQARQNKKEV